MSSSMCIYGLDFTSAPSSNASNALRCKRLVLAVCDLKDNLLKVESFQLLNGAKQGDFSGFEDWMRTEGPWIAGLDFPFGQPAQLINDLNWPKTWSGYVSHVNELGKVGFEAILEHYKDNKPTGRKEFRRETDCKAGAISPMKLYGVPVGKMFFQGATRLSLSGLSIHPVKTVSSEKRHVIEAHPALVARRCLINPTAYKSDDPKKNAEQSLKKAREQIINTICANNKSNTRFTKTYGVKVEMSLSDKDICINDSSGDFLDSVLCAIQAAWSYIMRENNYGIPMDASTLEGWICDPQTLEGIAK